MRFAANIAFSCCLLLSSAHAFANDYEDAVNSHQQGNDDAAVIQLKNWLRDTPDSADGRLLLGNIYFSQGRVAEAEKELALAVRLGKRDLPVIQTLLRSQLLSNQLTSAEKTLKDHWPVTEASGQRHLFAGQLAFQSKQFDKAENSFYQALEAGQTYEAKLGLATLARLRGDQEGALVTLADMTSTDNRLEQRRLLLKAELELDLKRPDDAIATLRSLASLAPDSPLLNLLYANAYLLKSEFTTAQQYLDKSPKAHHRLPQYQLYSAMVAMGQRQFQRAFEWTEKLIQQQPENLRGLLIAGSALFMMKDFEKATHYLETFVAKAPGEPNGRRLLAGSLLNIGKPLEALNTIEPMLSLANPDAKSLAIAGNANLALGNWKLGEEQLTDAIALDPSLENMRRALALGQVFGGDGESALSSLDEEQDIQAISIRLMALMQQQKYPEAHKLIDEAINQQPQTPMLRNLKGAIYLKENNVDAARSSYSKALELDPNFQAAALSIIQIDIVSKKLESAEQSIQRFLQQHPNSLSGLMAKASLAEAKNDQEALEKTLKAAQQQHPEAIQPVAALVSWHLQQQQPDKARHLANSFYLTHPEDLNAKFLYASTLKKTGKVKDATALATQLVNKRPNNSAYLELLTELVMSERRYTEAEQHAKHWLERQPNNPKALYAYIQSLLGQNKAKVAEPYLPKLIALAPSPAVSKIAGVTELQLQNYPKALTHLQSASQTLTDDAGLAAMTSTAYFELGNKAAAIEHAQTFFTQHPTALNVGLQLAGYYQQSQAFDQAIEVYETLRQHFPKEPIIWNNLAWFYQEKGDLRGLDYARQANRLAPERADIKDTLGWILYQYGEYQQALPLLADAYKAHPQHPEIQLHYGAVLMKNQRSSEAEKILKPLAEKPNPFQVEARDILSGTDS